MLQNCPDISIIKHCNVTNISDYLELLIMASSNSNPMDVDREEEEEGLQNYNSEEITSMAVELQNSLSKLKMEIIQAKARNKATKTTNINLQLEDDGELFGEGEEKVNS